MGRNPRARVAQLIMVGLLVSVAGCTPGPAQITSYEPDVIHSDGLRNIRFGDTNSALTQRSVLSPQNEACGPTFIDIPGASPVFADDRLVLVWADPPLRTPEGVGVGTPLDGARAAYPAARELTAPADSYRFDGLMVSKGDHAYLFLHDGKTVRKTVAGYADYAQRLFDEGFGTC